MFNEVVICLHRGSPLNPKFTVSSGSVYNFLVSLIKMPFTLPVLENGMSDIMMYFSTVGCSFSAVMLPLFVYVADSETYVCGSAVLRAKCKLYLSGQLAGTSTLAEGGCVLPDSAVFVQPLFEGAEGFPAVALQFAPGRSEKQHQHAIYREATENTIHSAVCLKC